MIEKGIKKTVIVGGGTAGWITAAALAKILRNVVDIELVESEDIGTIGVGEATIPQLKILNRALGLDEDEFVSRTNGTFKLGIQFEGWSGKDESYLHAFGSVGANYDQVQFHQYFLRHKQAGHAGSFWDYSLHRQAADQTKFGRLDKLGNAPMAGLSYAFHFDAGSYAKLLREHAEANGVKRTEGKVDQVNLDPETGDIRSLTLEDGRTVEGDLFIDCTGFRSLLLGQTLGVEFEDWSNWLPVNRAQAVGCERTEPLLPYTKAIARPAGWQWRIPLQHRTGNGHVYCDSYMQDSEARDLLMQSLDAAPIGEPRLLRFTTGRRSETWRKNCVAIGLSSGFLEPLESTSIHMIQTAVNRLISLFPSNQIDPVDVAEYNHQSIIETELIRDFLIMHYKLTAREDTPFWAYVKNMPIPDTLQHKLDIFESNGRIFRDQNDLFKENSWTQVMLGQGIAPRNHNVMADRITDKQLDDLMINVKGVIHKAIQTLPQHAAFISTHCAAK